MDEHEQRVREYVTRPWAERRGIERTDRSLEVILVRASLDELSDVLTVKVTEYNRGVLDTEVRVTETSVFAYQLVGHIWSIIPGHLPSYSYLELSKQLRQPVIRLDKSGCYAVEYEVLEKGELVEYFSGSEGDDLGGSNRYGVEPQRYLLFPYEGDGLEDDFEEDDDDDYDDYVDPNRQIAYFWSTRRQVTAEEISEISQFADRVLREYDAYVPDFDEGDVYFLGEVPTLGKTYRVQNPGTGMILGYEPSGQKREVSSIPEFVRIDHYRF